MQCLSRVVGYLMLVRQATLADKLLIPPSKESNVQLPWADGFHSLVSVMDSILHLLRDKQNNSWASGT